jgi:hypothetical protein
MRIAAWFAFLLCIPAFTQTTQDNAAAESFAKRLRSLKLLDSRPVPPTVKPALAAQVCAIPLLPVSISGFRSNMPVMKPAPTPVLNTSRELTVQVPAPACDVRLFQNR